jgi:hypothetical protein
MSPDLGIIKADYNIPEAAVFRIATRALIEKNNDLSILSLWRPSESDNLPSGAIDFTKSGGEALGSYRILNSKRLYRAGGDLHPEVKFENDASMTISGVPLGVLSFLGSTAARQCILGENKIDMTEILASKQFLNLRALQEAWLGAWLRQDPFLIDGKYIWTEEDICKAFARTTCYDFMLHDDIVPDRLGPTFEFTEDSCTLLLRSGMISTLANQIFAVTSLGNFCMVQENARAGI